MQKEFKAALKGIIWGFILLLTLFVLAFLYLNQEKIKDSLDARRYEPQPEILLIEKNIVLSPAGARIFHASHPSVENRDVFNSNCDQSEHTDEGSVLGCYVSQKIHLFDIEDDRLDGIMEVTAAHELLHAIYARLTPKQVESLQVKLIDLYQEKVSDNKQLEERMKVYDHLNDERFANELHSVFGTEIRELPEWLETHYAKWLVERTILVEYYEGYSDYFGEIQKRGEALVDKLNLLSAQIDDHVSSYSYEVENFNTEFELFLARNEAYEFQNNPDEFYALREMFDSRRQELQQQKVLIDSMIEEYNELQQDLESLNLITKELKQSLDSTLLPETN